MRRLAFALLCLAGTWGCGNETKKSHPFVSPPETLPVQLPLMPTPITSTTPITAPSSVTGSVELLGPALPAQAAVVRLRARVDVGSATGVTTVTSMHPGEALRSVAVPAGTVTLVFLDETGTATPFSTQVRVAAGGTAVVTVGSVRVSPASVVHPERAGTQALTYRIGQGSDTLENVHADLNTVVDLPQGTWEWSGRAQGGELPPVTLTVAGRLVDHEWGSVFVTKAPADTVTLRSAGGLVLYAQTTDRVEYLLPATNQTQGCMVYLGIVNQLTTDTITLCQDAVLHADLRAR